MKSSAFSTAGAIWLASGGRKAVELRAVEVMGDAAVARMQGGDDDRAADFINIPIEVRELRPGILQARGVGNTQLIQTSAGNVLFDAGLSIQAPKQMRLLKEAAHVLSWWVRHRATPCGFVSQS